ncbi:cobalamin B12-binding domain-containing protein [Streptomyces sp. DT171]|uniref:cobalamin B12-binding domain-containing protein n=1 Tax=Streptomyces sp. DT171 TaxID=3416524 RepID=UPI003CF98DD2
MTTDLTHPAGAAGARPAHVGDRRRGTVVVSTVASDSHTWNLVFLQLLIEELGYDVVNLGPCVPDDLLVETCREIAPDFVVISSVNGHGHQDGLRLITTLRSCAALAATPVVIGGKLGVEGQRSQAANRALTDAGFDAVFDDASTATAAFTRFVAALPALPGAPATPAEVGA